jgi:peptidase E
MNHSKAHTLYLLAGGSWKKSKTPDPLLQAVFSQSATPLPSVAYIGTASGEDDGFFQAISEMFLRSGAGSVSHAVIGRENADAEAAKKIILEAGLVFVSGGDVDEGIRVLREKKMIYFLKEMFVKGVPFFGLSAGSIMLAKRWIRWKDPGDDSTAELFPCLGFAPFVCDTHGEEEGWDELRASLKISDDGQFGYGIPSGAALRVQPDGRVEALVKPVHVFVRRGGKIVRLHDISPSEL